MRGGVKDDGLRDAADDARQPGKGQHDLAAAVGVVHLQRVDDGKVADVVVVRVIDSERGQKWSKIKK